MPKASYAMPAIPGSVIIMLPEEAVLCSHYAHIMLNYVMGFNL